MRYLLLFVACLIGSLSAADLSFARVTLPGGSELTGWWDPDARVMYQPDNKYTWIKTPKAVELVAAPQRAERPAKRTFKRLPDLPYGRIKAANGQEFVGWFHEDSGELFLPSTSVAFTSRSYGPGNAHLVEAMNAPGPMPTDARNHLDHWAISHADEIDKAEEKKAAAKP